MRRYLLRCGFALWLVAALTSFITRAAASDCAQSVPAVSSWGLIVLTLLLLVAAKAHALEGRPCSAYHG